MKAMVLAAGLGLRLRPITNSCAKPAVPFFGRPLLAHTLDLLAGLGVTHAIVNTHHRPNDLARIAREASIPVELSHEEEILGTGGGIAKVRERLRGEETFLLANGDIVFDLPLDLALAAHRRSMAAATLVLLPNPDPGRYGRILTSGEFGVFRSGEQDPSLLAIDRIVGPAVGGDGYLYSGVALFSGESLDRLPGSGPSDLVKALLGPLADEGKLAGFLARGLWYELGTERDYLGAHLDALRKILAGHPDTRRLGLRVVDRPLVFDRERRSAIHRDARIGGYLHEAIVDRSAIVEEGAVVRRSVLLPGAIIRSGRSVVDEVILGIDR